MKEWFSRFDQREQLSLVLLALAVSLYLLYMIVWSPLTAGRDALEQQNSQVADSLQRVDTMVSEIRYLRQNEGSQNRQSRNLTSLINRSTAQVGLQVSRLQPNSRGEIQVRLEGASFDELLLWLHQMEYQHGLLVREVSASQSGSGGRVNATVRIAQEG